jgi:hypothetical protein
MNGRVDFESGSAAVIQDVHSKLHDGRVFIASYKTPNASPLADDGTIDFLVVVGAIEIHPIFIAQGNNDLETVLYENTVVTNNGTSIPVIGMNRARSLSTTVTVFRDPTITNDGDLLFNDLRAWGINNENFVDGSWVLRPNVNYLFRVINRAGVAQPVSTHIKWYSEGARN